MIFTLIFRSIIIYIITLTLIRLMGKRQIGEMQPYELVMTLIVADLATIPMSDSGVPLLHGIIPLLTLVCVHYLLSLLERKSLYLRKLINGKPIILINPNGINYYNLKKCNMNFNDLQEALRTTGNFAIDEILYAIMQTNGTLSILPKANYAPLTAKNSNIEIEESGLPIIIIAEGKIIKNNLKLTKLSEQDLLKEIKKLGFNSLNEILFLTISNYGNIYIQGKNNHYKSTKIKYKGDW